MYEDKPTDDGGIERTVTPVFYGIVYDSPQEAEGAARMLDYMLELMSDHFDVYIRVPVVIEQYTESDGSLKPRWKVRARFAMTPPFYHGHPRKIGVHGQQHTETR